MKYDKRGVSADKKDVHEAIKNQDKGLYPDAFCKILPDSIYKDPEYAMLMHADTAGTKTVLAYLYWKESGDLSVWEGIVQDAIVMNIDDMACAGALDDFVLSSTMGRNKNLITAEVIKTIIESAQKLTGKFADLGFNLYLAGGETADVGDIVRTIDIGFTAYARLKRDQVIRINPQEADVIVGLESGGQSTYEENYNSGIGCNGLTFARHELLDKSYAEKYPESFDPHMDPAYVYTRQFKLMDESKITGKNIGQLLLSPTRTYLPVIAQVSREIKDGIHGIIHNTGGGQTKILHFIDKQLIVKDNLLDIPPVFQYIREQANTDWKEMFQVFNMGQRLEFYTHEKNAERIISIAKGYNIHAQVVGHVEKSTSKRLLIKHKGNKYSY
ncbi:MAG: phosphoribosylformylglycinamidine cyclo-ligase [Bacteroidetes bacterium]|nr:phosphoribosylformylglycinamidine cyclo-ligase [Bacteroidota bacterium]